MSKDSKRRMKKKHSQNSVRIGERATPERSRQLGGLIAEIVDRDATGRIYIERQRVKHERVIDIYLRYGGLSEAQHKAADRMDGLYLRIHECRSCLGNLNSLIDNCGTGGQERKMVAFLDCEVDFLEAFKLLTDIQRRVVWKVCCYGEYAGGKHPKEALVRGLQTLAAHWGYA